MLGVRLLLVAIVLSGLVLPPLAAVAAEPEGIAAKPTEPDSPPNVLDGHKLVAALRGGGYIIYFRHGITDLSTSDTDRDHLENCATQRVLSPEGRQQMRAIGRTMLALRIPIGQVLSSPYCRSVDTVTLAFGKAQKTDDLVNTVTADEETVAHMALALRKLLATPPAHGANTVLSGHTGNLQEASGIWPKPEGTAIIFKPEGDGKFSYIARIVPTHWQELARGEDETSKRNKR